MTTGSSSPTVSTKRVARPGVRFRGRLPRLLLLPARLPGPRDFPPPSFLLSFSLSDCLLSLTSQSLHISHFLSLSLFVCSSAVLFVCGTWKKEKKIDAWRTIFLGVDKSLKDTFEKRFLESIVRRTLPRGGASKELNPLHRSPGKTCCRKGFRQSLDITVATGGERAGKGFHTLVQGLLGVDTVPPSLKKWHTLSLVLLHPSFIAAQTHQIPQKTKSKKGRLLGRWFFA